MSTQKYWAIFQDGQKGITQHYTWQLHRPSLKILSKSDDKNQTGGIDNNQSEKRNENITTLAEVKIKNPLG